MANATIEGAKINRTGIQQKQSEMQDMVEAAEHFGPSSTGEGLEQIRAAYAQESGEIGHLPPPKKKSALAAMDGLAPLLVDKIGARIAFERTGTRFWQALLQKFDALGGFDGGPTREEIDQIRQDEHEHFLMLTASMTQLGGDPTAVTPSADLEAITSRGVGDVLADPRTSVLQGLESLVVAELADREQWEALVELAIKAGQAALAETMRRAQADEERHLVLVRRWVAAGRGQTS